MREIHTCCLTAVAESGGRGYIEFNGDPSDTDALMADIFTIPTTTQRRQIRETENGAPL